MDDLLREFLTETSESLDTVDNQLVRFEQDPNNAKILDNIFRLVHTIKGTCGFLGLPRLEALAHAGETLMGKFRDGMPVTGEAVSLILSSIDRIKEILAGLEATETEPEGTDQDLIDPLVELSMKSFTAGAEPPAPAPAAASPAQGTLVPQILERELRPAKSRWMNWSAPSARPRSRPPPAAPQPAPAPVAAAKPEACRRARGPPRQGPAGRRRAKARRRQIGDRERSPGSRQDRQPVDPGQCRYAGTPDDHGVGTGADPQPVAGDLTAQRGYRVQGAAAAALNVTAELQEGVMKTRMQPIGNAWQKLPRIVRDPLRRTQQADRTGDARRRHRARPPGARPDQGSLDPHGGATPPTTAWRPRPSGSPPASRSRAPSGSRPIMKAATSSSASPTTAAGSTPSGSRPRRSPMAWSARPNWRR